MSKSKTVTEPEIKQPRMGIVRYLQLNPQSPTVESFLKAKYGGEVKTGSEWENAIRELMASKVTT